MVRCPKGDILRRGYTAKHGSKTVKVKPSCIKARSLSGSKRSVTDRAYLAKRKKIQEEVGRRYGSKKCPPGKILRAGYTKNPYNRKSYTRKSGSKVRAAHVGRSTVKPVCVRDIGAPGKGEKIPVVLQKGLLKSVGYYDVKDMSVDERHKALSRAVSLRKNPLSLYRKLIIIGTMNKRKDPNLSSKFRSDAAWVKKTYGV